MGLTIKTTFTITNQYGEKETISYPYLNNDKELEFKYCSFSDGIVLFNREKKALELQSRKTKVYILLKDKNEDLSNELFQVRESIMNDLLRLNIDFKSGKEEIYLMETALKEMPYLITSPTVIENGLFSVKYNNAVIYYINQSLKKNGHKSDLDDYEGVLKVVGEVLKGKDLSEYKSNKYQENKGYLIPIQKFDKLLAG